MCNHNAVREHSPAPKGSPVLTERPLPLFPCPPLAPSDPHGLPVPQLAHVSAASRPLTAGPPMSGRVWVSFLVGDSRSVCDAVSAAVEGLRMQPRFSRLVGSRGHLRACFPWGGGAGALLAGHRHGNPATALPALGSRYHENATCPALSLERLPGAAAGAPWVSACLRARAHAWVMGSTSSRGQKGADP